MYPPLVSMWVVTPHNCFCTLTSPLTLSLTHLMAHATSSQTFSRTISYPSSFYSHLPAYEDGTECSETSAYKLQTSGNYPKESIQHTEHGESLKSRIYHRFCAKKCACAPTGFVVVHVSSFFCNVWWFAKAVVSQNSPCVCCLLYWKAKKYVVISITVK